MNRLAILAFGLFCVLGFPHPTHAEVQALVEEVGDPEEVTAGGEVIAGPSMPLPAPGAAAGSSRLRVGGYLDLGASRVQNGGRGFVFDTAGAFSSRYPEVAWVLLGDPWSTPINSRGDPGDTAGSFALPQQWVGTDGAFGFLVNEVNLDFAASPLPSLFVFASVDLLPRLESQGAPGDLFEVDFAYVDWTPFDRVDLTLSAGKFDPVFGREYRLRESPDRPGITPSLLFRYVGGQPVGLKARGRFFDQRRSAALAVQNGPSFISSMAFSSDVSRVDLKTGAGRLSYALPSGLLGGGQVEVGLSGEAGPQGRQRDDSLLQWQWGFDAYVELPRLELRWEFVRGIAPGGGLDSAESLHYRAFFAEAFARPLPWLGVILRYEQRHAVHQGGDTFVYLIHVQRAVAGVRFDPTHNVAVKLEYLLNLELDPLPSFPNDVALASLVLSF